MSVRLVTLAEILAAACDYYHVSGSEFVGDTRMAYIVNVRYIYVVLARILTNCSFPEVALATGRKSHSSMVSRWQRGIKRAATDLEFRSEIMAVAWRVVGKRADAEEQMARCEQRLLAAIEEERAIVEVK